MEDIIEICPHCKSKMEHEYVERENPAGDYLNEYLVSQCSNPECKYKEEKLIGGRCNPDWGIDSDWDIDPHWDIDIPNAYVTHVFEIDSKSIERVLDIVAQTMTDVGYHPNKRTLSLVKWRDRKGFFHTCEIFFYIKDGNKLNVHHCGHLGKIMRDCVEEIAANELFTA